MRDFRKHPKTNHNGYYGCEEFGRLRRVLVHQPGPALALIHESNKDQWLFDAVPDTDAFIQEHQRYQDLLRSLDIEVNELSDYVVDNVHLLDQLPNLTYMHDIAVVSSRGAYVSKMSFMGRKQEDRVVAEGLRNLGIPIRHWFDREDDACEGMLLLSPRTVLIANTERHKWSSIARLMPHLLEDFEEVIYVETPKARRYMHPDTIYNRVDRHLALAYLPAFESVFRFTAERASVIDFEEYMASRGVEIISVSDDEQKRLACSFVPLEPGVMIHYDTALDAGTRRLLEQKGVELILFHPEALAAGGGSLRCMTLRLHREA
jgi:arginine deiminase